MAHTAVLVWLGPNVGETLETGAKQLRRMGREVERDMASDEPINRDKRLRHITDQLLEYPGTEEYSAFLELCKKTYWTRMWIMQEVALAKRACLLTGHRTFSWFLVRHVLLR